MPSQAPRAIRPGMRAQAVCLGVSAVLGSAIGGWSPAAKAASPPVRPVAEVGPVRTRTLHIERIEIRGREQVSERQIAVVLEREGLRAGADVQWPEDPRVVRARDRLRATGYFKQVTFRLEPLRDQPSRTILILELTERSSLSIPSVYLANSEMTPFHGGLEIFERNFMGRSVHLGGAFVWGTLPNIDRGNRQQAYQLFAEVPRLGTAPLGVLTRLYLVSANEPYRVSGTPGNPNPDQFRAFDYTRIGGLVGLTFPVLPDLTLAVDYRFERVDALLPVDPNRVTPEGEIVPVDLDMRDGIHRLTSANFHLAWDDRQGVGMAGKGGRIALDLQLSSPGLGSQYEYIKLVAGGAYTFRLPWKHWITPGITAGQLAGDAPVFEQFYSGDLSDWTPGREMGLRYSTRNPIDVFGTGVDRDPFGVLFGRADLEYVWPLFRRTRTRLFYGGDLFFSTGVFTLAGDRDQRAAAREAGRSPAPIGFNANAGVRLDTALGTVDLSVGNILRRTPL